MWKYQCKKHLGIILGAAVFGAIAFAFLGYSQDSLKEAAKLMNQPEVLNIPYLPYITGALLGAGAANGMLLIMYVIQRFRLSFLFMYVVIFLLFTPMSIIGMITLFPAIGVCIYGWLTIPNRGRRADLKKNAVSSVAEVDRVYRLHHTYKSEYEDLAKKAWDYMLRMNLVYIIGLLVIFLLIIWFNDMFMLFAAFIIYAVLFFYMNRKKTMALEPIISLLYEACDPEACASAILALAKKSKKRKNFPLPQYLAQCMIYLNDPHLAVDVMVTCERNKNAMIFPYYSVMAYAYYQLGDESMVKFQYDECVKNSARMLNGPMGIMRQQTLDGVQNKMQMMEKDFAKSKVYFEELLTMNTFEFQKVDAHYYLGLISFVDRDLRGAENHFRYVVNHGNRMYVVSKAETFLKTIEASYPQDEE